MDVEVATVFVNFQVFVPFPASTKESRTPFDLVQVAKTAWNTEVVRNSRGELLHCTIRFPPLTHDGVLYSGPVLTVRPSGMAEMVGSGSVAAIVTFTHHARAVLLDAARRCPPPQTIATKSRKISRSPLLDECVRAVDTTNPCCSLSEARYLEDHRLMAALRGERSDASLFQHSASLFANLEEVRGVPLLEATTPSVSFFNAILRPEPYELLEAQKHFGFRDLFYDFVPYGSRRDPRVAFNVTGDATLEWLHRFLAPVASSTTATNWPQLSTGDAAFSQQELAYLAPKREQLKVLLASFTAQRFERQYGIQLVLNFSTRKSVENTAATDSDAAAQTMLAWPSVAPNLASVDVFFTESVLPPTQVQPHPNGPDMPPPPPTVPQLAFWEETIKCSLFSTGKIQATAKSEKGLEIALRLVLLPLMVCRADVR